MFKCFVGLGIQLGGKLRAQHAQSLGFLHSTLPPTKKKLCKLQATQLSSISCYCYLSYCSDCVDLGTKYPQA